MNIYFFVYFCCILLALLLYVVCQNFTNNEPLAFPTGCSLIYIYPVPQLKPELHPRCYVNFFSLTAVLWQPTGNPDATQQFVAACCCFGQCVCWPKKTKYFDNCTPLVAIMYSLHDQLDAWQCPAWWPPVGWVRTPVLFFSIYRPKYTELSLPVRECL